MYDPNVCMINYDLTFMKYYSKTFQPDLFCGDDAAILQCQKDSKRRSPFITLGKKQVKNAS
jgi:hypothetical protein